MRRTIVGVLLALGVTTGCAAQEWSRFRGVRGQGIGEADLPTVFGKEHIRWRTDLQGTGHSSPVLWGSRLFLTRVNGAKGKREIVCYDADSGKQTWGFDCDFKPHKQHRLNSFASSTPAADELGVYVTWSSGDKLVAIALSHQGKLLWMRELGGYYAQHGSANSPVMHGELVVVANENEGDDCFLTALDRKTGKDVWREPLQKSPRWACYSPPFLYEPKAGKPVMLIASAAHGLTAFEPETGKVRWRANPGFKSRFIAAPTLAGDKLLVNTGSGDSGKECVIYDLKDAKDEPKILSQPRRGLPYVPSGLALDGRFFLFADSGFASCLEAADGKQLWRERIDGKFFSSPVSNGDAIYIGDREGKLWTFSREKFEVIGSFDLGSPINATPALARGAMFVRTAGELIRLQNAAK
jgi:outer membrane protein assembly factor BamB